jgi:phosphoglycerate dehydrogenase-like enzyme
MNVLLTPHTAAGAPSNPNVTGRHSEFTNIVRYLEGKPLLHRVS